MMYHLVQYAATEKFSMVFEGDIDSCKAKQEEWKKKGITSNIFGGSVPQHMRGNRRYRIVK